MPKCQNVGLPITCIRIVWELFKKHIPGPPPQISEVGPEDHFQISIPTDSYVHWHLETADAYSEGDSAI